MSGHRGHRVAWRRRRAVAAAAVTVLGYAAATLTGCDGAGEDARSAGDTAVPAGPVTVFAAASLTDVLAQVAEDFEAAQPDVTVELSFAGSSTLAAQINQGAPADVLVSANPATMATVVDAGNADGTPRTIVRNELVIAVAAGNPLRIRGLADLADPEVTIAMCAEQVPCGAASATALAAADVEITPATLEADVRATLSKLRLGEVDAALVYRTDAVQDPDVDSIEFPESASAVNDYPAVVVAHAPHPAGARAFVDYLGSDDAAARFAAAGFLAPEQ